MVEQAPTVMNPQAPVSGYVMAVPPGAMPQNVSAHLATPGVVAPAPVPVPMPASGVAANQAAQGTDWKGMAYGAAANGAWMGSKVLGSAVAPVAAVFTIAGANHEAHKNVKEVLEQYRAVLAERLNIAPEAVDETAMRTLLEESPDEFPAIRQALGLIDKKQTDTPWISMAAGGTGVAAFAAGTAVGAPLGPLAPLVGIGAAIAAPWCVEKAGGAILGASNLDDSAHAAIKAINEKWSRGEQVSPLEIFTLFARMDSGFRESISERTGKDILSMNEQEQIEFITRDEPKLGQASAQIAYLLNARIMMPSQLAGVNPRQLCGQQPVVIAGASPQVARTNTGNAQRTATGAPPAQPQPQPRGVTPRGFASAELARRAANENLPGQTGRIA